MRKENGWEAMACGREPGGANADALGVCRAALDGAHAGLNDGWKAGRACWGAAGSFAPGAPDCSAARTVGCLSCAFFEQVRAEQIALGKFKL